MPETRCHFCGQSLNPPIFYWRGMPDEPFYSYCSLKCKELARGERMLEISIRYLNVALGIIEKAEASQLPEPQRYSQAVLQGGKLTVIPPKNEAI